MTLDECTCSLANLTHFRRFARASVGFSPTHVIIIVESNQFPSFSEISSIIILHHPGRGGTTTTVGFRGGTTTTVGGRGGATTTVGGRGAGAMTTARFRRRTLNTT
ncbi:hypothetical protein NECAME_10121 [Necator americanus]|uniref:Uncharacterized protein n=1 Tax=Necator americanus TaxID=51031 RepID=W2TCC5_NECAM|nr:hypothetical protein NECAME_10121 [Necator americanus]ETN78821.1 hypothetical protein NECAME_10121 [Necator americanus]